MDTHDSKRHQDFRILPARQGQAELLSSMAFRSKACWGYDAEFMRRCRAELTWSEEQLGSRHYEFHVGWRKNVALAFYALTPGDNGMVELEALFVEPRFLRTGIGSLLMQHAKARAIALGGTRLVIQGDPHAASFYLANGAILCGSRESESISGRFLPLFELMLDKPVTTCDKE